MKAWNKVWDEGNRKERTREEYEIKIDVFR
jgi:hypothetical protein